MISGKENNKKVKGKRKGLKFPRKAKYGEHPVISSQLTLDVTEIFSIFFPAASVHFRFFKSRNAPVHN